jgi:Ca2+-binding RTX toxin-like protein
MATTIEYALMAGASYRDTRPDINKFPIPAGWNMVSRYPQDNATGFEAAALGNSATITASTEIVISYAGSYDKDYTGDWVADAGLASGEGSAQLLQAAEYYLQIKAATASNPNVHITLTGHSLGGGLAALVGVFFGVQATTFDQAPFALSAEKNLLTPDVALNLLNTLLGEGYSETTLVPLFNFLEQRDAHGGIPNSNLISNIRVDGEFLSADPPFNLINTIGTTPPANVLTHGQTNVSGGDLHSIALLTAFLQSDQSAAASGQTLREVTRKITDLLEMIFDNNLFAHETDPSNTTEVNLLEHLIRHQVGVQNSFAADAMLDRFTADLCKIAQEGGLTMANKDLTNALTAFAMQAYYDNRLATTVTLFEGITGGIRFDRRNVAETLDSAKGNNLYLQAYLNNLPTTEREAITSQLSNLIDWYIQAGTQAMNATAGAERAFMLGGGGNDQLTGGSQADVLIGNGGTNELNGSGGDDILIGGTGRDIFRGGAGVDEYHVGSGDIVNDSDGKGKLFYGRTQISGLAFTQQSTTNIYFNETTGLYASYDAVSKNLQIFADGSPPTSTTPTNFTVKNFSSGNFGITLTPTDAPPQTYNITLTGTAERDEMAILSYASEHRLSFTSYSGGEPLTPSIYNELLPPTAPHMDITGGDSGDFLFGFAGHDQIDGGGGGDIITGYMGWWNGTDLDAIMPGTLEGDLLSGGSGGDYITGTGGADTIDGGADNDILSGFDGNDLITGDSGNDVLLGASHNDILVGGDGDDIILGEGYLNSTSVNLDNLSSLTTTFNESTPGGYYSGYTTTNFALHTDAPNGGADILEGGAGRDYLDGGTGQDFLYGGLEADTIIGGDGDDYQEGGDGNDWLVGDNGDLTGSGADYMFGDAGNDLMYGLGGNDTLYGGTGSDDMYGNAGDDYLDSEGGDDHLYGGDGVDTLVSGDGLDYLSGGGGNDLLIAGLGDDTLDGGAGDDTYVYNLGDGADVIVNKDSAGLDTVAFGAGISQADVQAFKDGNYLILQVGATGNQVAVKDYFIGTENRIDQLTSADGTTITCSDFLTSTQVISYGTSTNDTLTGYEGADYIYGNSGNDTLNGGGGDDTLDGGLGSDTMSGGTGNDVYLVDIASDVVNELAGEGTDTIYTTISYNLGVNANVEDLILTGTAAINCAGNTLDNVLIGNSADNTLNGAVGADILDGGAGNDTLIGGTGDNGYLFGKGDGQDVINSTYDNTTGRLSILQFKPGVLPGEVIVKQLSGALELSITGTTDKITINQFFYTDNPYNSYNGVQQVQFDDGTIWDILTLLGKAFAVSDANDSIRGTIAAEVFTSGLGDDTLYGAAGDDILNGGDGVDTLYGEAGADALYGGAGNDVLDGGTDADTLDGGTGNDTLTGGTGNNTYLFGKSDGQDLIKGQTNDTMAGKLNTVQFKAGVLPSEVVVKQVYDSFRGGNQALELSIAGTTDKITINSFFYTNNPANGYNGVQQVKFDDGTVWDITALLTKYYGGTDDDDTIHGTSSGDTIGGGQGNDWLYGEAGADTIKGGAGNDVLDGGADDDILEGGSGSDSLCGDTGNNSYLFDKGDGQDLIMDQKYYSGDKVITTGKINTVEFKLGVLPNEVIVKHCWSQLGFTPDLELNIAGTTDKITIEGFFFNNDPANSYNPVQQVKFADGMIWDIATLTAKTLTATDGNDHIQGTVANETINGGLGDDALYGGGGYDTIDGGEGVDNISGSGRLMGGDGNDNLLGDDGNDILEGGDGDDTVDGGAGDNILNGGAGNDNLKGGSFGDDLFDGGTGNDTLGGSGGNSTYLFGKSDGQDVIYNWRRPSNTSPGQFDILQFKDGVAPSEIVIRQIERGLANISYGINNLTSQHTTELELSITGTSDKITINSFSSTSSTMFTSVQRVVFADDTTWEIADLCGTLYAGTVADDITWGTRADETISGDAGADTLYGYGGNDILDGGIGNDTLSGGVGDNTYLFGRGDGQDVIVYADDGEDSTPGALNTLQFKETVLPSEIMLKIANDINNYGSKTLELSIAGTTDKITISDFINSNGSTGEKLVQQVRFADGTTLTRADLLAKLYIGTDANDFFIGTPSDDTIDGSGGHDIVNGGAGNDTMYGGTGVDTLNSGAGNDLLYGGGGDGDIFDGGTGNDTLYGSGSDDIYLFGRGDGQDVIVGINNITAGKLNTLRFKEGVLPSEIVAQKVNQSLELSITGNDKITINGFFTNNNPADPGNPIQQVQFADGTIWDVVTMQAMTAGNIKKGTAKANTLNGSTTLANNITGLGGNDTLNGGSGSDWLDGGSGVDTMTGGGGNDLYVVDTVSDVVTEQTNNGNDTVRASISYTLSSNLENLILTGTTALNGTGNTDNNNLIGNTASNILNGEAGDDVLFGGGAADILSGGAGNDTYWVDNPGDVVNELAGAGTDTVNSTISYTLGENVEKLTLFGTDQINGTGNALDNTLTNHGVDNTLRGGAGNDTLYGGNGSDILDGGTGADTMIGGYGNHIYMVDDAGDVVLGSGTVCSSVTYSLNSYNSPENLTLIGSATINGKGNSANNVINGNDAANTLTGDNGMDILFGNASNDILDGSDYLGSHVYLDFGYVPYTDTMYGGIGDDTYIVETAADVVIEQANEGTDTVISACDYTLGENIENLTLTYEREWYTYRGGYNGTGNALDNVLTGNSSANVLIGLVGNDTLIGIGGGDTLIGGQGDDTYLIDYQGETNLVELANEGTDTVVTSFNYPATYTLGANIENLTLTGTAAINGTGNELDNVLTGNSGVNIMIGGAGNDTLDGGFGTDKMTGGTGDDIYLVDVAGDVVSELTGEGTDTVISTITYTLANNVENITLTGTTLSNSTGNTLANTLIGNSATNILSGLGGNDTLKGAGGDDIYQFSQGGGFDTIYDGQYAKGDANNTIADDAYAGGNDMIRFGTGITANNIAIFRNGNDLVIGYGTTDQVTVQDSVNYGNKIERLELSSGAYLTDADLNRIIQDMSAFAVNNGIALTSIDDVRNNQQMMNLVATSWH